MLGKKFIGWIGLFLASFFAGKNIFWRKRGFDPLKGHHANVSWPSFFHCFLLKKMQVTSRWKRKRKANNKTRSVEWVRLWGSESWQEVRIAWLNRKIIERFGPYHRWIHGFIYLLICHELVHEETSFIEKPLFFLFMDPYKQEQTSKSLNNSYYGRCVRLFFLQKRGEMESPLMGQACISKYSAF